MRKGNSAQQKDHAVNAIGNQGDQKIGGKNCQKLGKVAKTVSKPKRPKYLHLAQFESPKHQNRTTFEPLKT
jgi:hypothetical protein